MTQQTIDIKLQSQGQPLAPSAEHQRLDLFVGKWHTQGLSYGSGQSKENPHDSAVRWIGAETYEWLPGGFFLVNHFDAKIGNTAISGIETVGYDPVSQSYPSQLFDSYGRILSGQRSIRDGVWSSSIGTEYRTTYAFRNEGNTLASRWEWLDGDDWFVLADLEATNARNWTLDLKERKIRVNAISPGTVPTPAYDRLGLDDRQLQEFVDSQVVNIPLGRVGTPDEIAKAVVFLASDDSSFVNGIELFVDGGMAQI